MSYDLENIPPASIFLDAYSDSLVYHDAVWLTAHNAFANKEDGWLLYAQQNLNLPHMFEQGVRSFMLDVYYYNNDLYLCHGGCGVTTGAQKLFQYPDKLGTWFQELHNILQNNPADIVTVHLECYVAAHSVLAALHNTGLDGYMLKSKNPNDPTLILRDMRQNDERLVMFSDYTYERQAGTLYNLKPYEQLGLFSTLNYKETQYSIDTYNNCTMRDDFRANATDPTVKLVVFNHFSSVSIAKDYGSINRYSDIMKRVTSCLSSNLFPNFISVDFFELGDCSHCISTKNVVYTLNLLHPAIQNNINNYTANTSSIQQKLPIYSHTKSFFEYCAPFLMQTLIFIAGVATGFVIHKKYGSTKPANKLKTQ